MKLIQNENNSIFIYLEKNVQIEVEKMMVHVLKDMEFAVHVGEF